MWATRSTALLAGLLLGAPLASATSFSFTFEASAALGLAAAAVALWMHEPRHAAVEAREAMGQTLLRGVREAWQRPSVRYVILYSGVVSLGFFGPVVIFQQPWLAEHGVATERLGLWQAPARAGEIAAALGAGWLLLRMGERGAFFALPVTLVACNLALAGIDHAWIAVAFIGMGVVSGLQNPFLASYINHRIASERRATVLSVQNVVQNVMLAGAQPLGGAIADAWGLQAVFLMFAMSVLVLGGGTLLLWERARAGDRQLPAFAGTAAAVPADGA
jgi:predicted MFS family arabinose efflux permease